MLSYCKNEVGVNQKSGRRVLHKNKCKPYKPKFIKGTKV